MGQTNLCGLAVLTLGKEWALLVRLLIQLHMANLL